MPTLFQLVCGASCCSSLAERQVIRHLPFFIAVVPDHHRPNTTLIPALMRSCAIAFSNYRHLLPFSSIVRNLVKKLCKFFFLSPTKSRAILIDVFVTNLPSFLPENGTGFRVMVQGCSCGSRQLGRCSHQNKDAGKQVKNSVITIIGCFVENIFHILFVLLAAAG